LDRLYRFRFGCQKVVGICLGEVFTIHRITRCCNLGRRIVNKAYSHVWDGRWYENEHTFKAKS
jgi:hypothetical protein